MIVYRVIGIGIGDYPVRYANDATLGPSRHKRFLDRRDAEVEAECLQEDAADHPELAGITYYVEEVQCECCPNTTEGQRREIERIKRWNRQMDA
ncbi:MAG: hypothetical protein ACRD2L_01200 [Terriglobia bacterium]